jgi:D-alanyl-D-alanine-carboxypeptidase/D-alanyl-D-alanine-endopeptidase
MHRVATRMHFSTGMNGTIRILLPIGLALTSAAFAQTQSAPIAPSSDEVRVAVIRSADKYFKDAPQAVALSIGVFRDGNSYIYNFGSVHRDKHDQPSGDTLYPIASITKTFTGTLLAHAVIEGKLHFTDDVREYLGGAYPNLEYEGHPIELQFLVNHISGLPFNLPDIPGNRPPFTPPMSAKTLEFVNHYTRTDFLRDLHAVKLTSIPGRKFSYSNTGAVLLSLVLERVYGESFEKIVQQKITAPLGMKDTTISLSRSQRRRLAPGYNLNGAVNSDQSSMALGAGGLKSTVSDLLKYAAWETAQDDPAVNLSHEPRLNPAPDYSIGLNWNIIRRGKDIRIWQDGSVPGFLSFCIMFPQLHMAIVVLTNAEDPVTSKAFDAIAPSIAESIDPRSSALF